MSRKPRKRDVGGVRTPFVRAFREFLELDTIDLGTAASRALIERFDVPRDQIDSMCGAASSCQALRPTSREIALDLGLPHRVEGMTCTRACASGLQAVTLAAAAIERGEYDVAIAGGSDSTSNGELKVPQKAVRTLGPLFMGGGKPGPGDYLSAVTKLAPFTDLIPQMPRIAERTTGQVMGEAAEEMAFRNGITREAQDRLAAASHHRAAEAISTGRFDEEVAPLETRRGTVYQDTLVRANTSIEKLAKLRPVFAKKGTLTAGNSSPLTDGASAVLLMSEEGPFAWIYATCGLSFLGIPSCGPRRPTPDRTRCGHARGFGCSRDGVERHRYRRHA